MRTARVGPGARGVGSGAAVAFAVALAVGLSGCAAPSRPRADGCPSGLLDAVERSGVIAGTPGAVADTVPAAELGSPLAASLIHGCVVRVRYTYRGDTPVSFEAFTVGGSGTAASLATALLRDGWTADEGPTVAFRHAGGGTATVDAYPAGRFAALLPSGYRLPADSPYADASVVVLGVTLPRRPSLTGS